MRECIDINDDFFSSSEIAEVVFEAINQFATGADTITLEELRLEVAQSGDQNDTRFY